MAIIDIAVPGGMVTLDITATFVATPPAPTPPPPAPTPPPPAPTPPPPAPTPPPPSPSPIRKALQMWHKPGQPIGNPADTATKWSDHFAFRTPVNFLGVQVLFLNPFSTVRQIPAHMVGLGPAGGLTPAAWLEAGAAVTVPAGTAQRTGYAVGPVIPCTPVAASDGGPAWVHVRADMFGAVGCCTPDNYDDATWSSAYPHQPLRSFRRYGAHAATLATAGTSTWIDSPGMSSVGGLILHHASPAAALIVVGDSIADGDLITPGACNYQSASWRAVATLKARGVNLTYGRLSQGGAQWGDIQHQVEQAIAAGVIGPGVHVAMPSFTPNDPLTPATSYDRALTVAALVSAAGGQPHLIAPWPTDTTSAARAALRATVMSSATAPHFDPAEACGLAADRTVFAAGMCGDPIGSSAGARGVHPSPAANAAVGAAYADFLQALIAAQP